MIIFHPFNKPLKHKITLIFMKNNLYKNVNLKYLGTLIEKTLSWKFLSYNVAITFSGLNGIFYKISLI